MVNTVIVTGGLKYLFFDGILHGQYQYDLHAVSCIGAFVNVYNDLPVTIITGCCFFLRNKIVLSLLVLPDKVL